ncbi:MAG: SMC-Scp complex subunit ScpB [Candidatus Korobacteraceae bacterium]|jgi:segregation and condensation protein B
MSLKAKVEAIIYATEEPVTLNELASLLKDTVLAELRAEEEARLALNETVSDGQPVPEGDEALITAKALEEAAAEFANEPSATAEAIPVVDQLQPESSGSAPTKKEQKQAEEKEQLKAVKARLSTIVDELVAEYASSDRGMEIRQIAGGYRMATKPEHHDVVVSFAKSLKPPVRLSLQALETLSVIAYKQPVTVPEISEIRGVDSAGVIATLLDRKLITTAGRKQVIGRPILYKTTKEFLLRFGLNDVSELPSMEEFEKLGEPQAELFSAPATETASPNPASASEAASEAAPETEPVTEAVPEQNAAGSLLGETAIPADGTYATEAEPPREKS